MAYANGRIPTSAMSPIPAAFHTHGTTAYLQAGAADAFLRVAYAFEKRFGKRLVAMSFYRPLADQIRIFLKNYFRVSRARSLKTDRSYNGSTYQLRADMAPVASPGYSNHGLGTTVDFNSGVQISGSAEHAWMLSEGSKYGWDWAEGKRIGEPWHMSYHASKDVKRNAPKASGSGTVVGSTTVADLATTQAVLLDLGYEPGPVDGKLGTTTKSAVRAFQTAAGITADGIPGPTTREALDTEMATVKAIVTQNQIEIRAARAEAKRAADIATANQREIREAKAEAKRAADVATVNQGTIRETNARLAPIRRGGKEVEFRQELADVKTILLGQDLPAIIRAAVADAGSQNPDVLAESIAERLADGLTLTVSATAGTEG